MTTSNRTPKLQVGGTLNPRQHLYLTRQDVEDRVYDLLIEGEYCNILSSRQVGKSSIVIKTALRLRESGVEPIYIDIAGELGTPDSAEQWYEGFLGRLARGLRINVNVKDWWEQQVEGTANQRFLRFFREKVAPAVDAPIVVFVDEIDSTLKLAYTDDFFTAIRTMYNERSMVPAYERVTFCLAGVANPNELVKDARTTAYNVGRTIEVRDFEEGKDDLTLLEQALGDAVENPKEMVHEVLAVTGGHPYLTTRLCQEVIEQKLQSSQALAEVVGAVFPSIEKVASDVHFQQIVRFWGTRVMEESDEEEKLEEEEKLAILTLYDNILKGKRVRDEAAPRYIKLKLSGIVKRDDTGHLVVRNKIYEKIFDRRWVREQMPLSLWKRIPLWLKVSIGALVVIVWLLAILAQQTNEFANEQGLLADSLRIAQRETLREANVSDSLRGVAEANADSLREQVAISDSLRDLSQQQAAIATRERQRALEEADTSRYHRRRADSLLVVAAARADALDDQIVVLDSLRLLSEIALAREIGILRADSLGRIVSGLIERGAWEEAGKHTLTMLGLYEGLGNRAAEADAYSIMGDVNKELGMLSESSEMTTVTFVRYALALDSYEKALEIFRDLGGDVHTEANILAKIGDVYARQLNIGGETSRMGLIRALTHYEASLDSMSVSLDSLARAATLNKKGDVHHRLGEHEEELAAYLGALSIYEKIPDQQGEAAETAIKISNTYEALGKSKESRRFYERSGELSGVSDSDVGVSAEIGGYSTGTTGAGTIGVTGDTGFKNDQIRVGFRGEFATSFADIASLQSSLEKMTTFRFGPRVSWQPRKYIPFRVAPELLFSTTPNIDQGLLQITPGVEALVEYRQFYIGARGMLIVVPSLTETVETEVVYGIVLGYRWTWVAGGVKR